MDLYADLIVRNLPKYDLDYCLVCSDIFPYFSEGSNLTPAHHFPDFRFKTYAPVAFRYFRELFGIRPDDYLVRFDFLICVPKLIKVNSYHMDA